MKTKWILLSLLATATVAMLLCFTFCVYADAQNVTTVPAEKATRKTPRQESNPTRNTNNQHGTDVHANTYVISISQKEIDMLVQLVQHEVGTSPTYYPVGNFDYIQQCMTKLVINRAKRSNLSVRQVIAKKGQFENWHRMSRFSKDHETTRKNVEIVLRGEDKISSSLLFQMSFKKLNLTRAIRRMEKRVGKIETYHHAKTADGRLIVFATIATSTKK